MFSALVDSGQHLGWRVCSDPSWNFRMHIYTILAAKEQGQAQKEGRDAKLFSGIWLLRGPKWGASAV